jgi:hypothetical protein
MTDTPPEVERIYRDLLMSRSPSERFMMASRMFDAARNLILQSIPKDLPERERKRLLYERIYGESAPEDAFPR